MDLCSMFPTAKLSHWQVKCISLSNSHSASSLLNLCSLISVNDPHTKKNKQNHPNLLILQQWKKSLTINYVAEAIVTSRWKRHSTQGGEAHRQEILTVYSHHLGYLKSSLNPPLHLLPTQNQLSGRVGFITVTSLLFMYSITPSYLTNLISCSLTN